MPSHEWNAIQYDANARFVSDLGAPVLDLLAAQPHEHILDLGCGDGALTLKIPGHVVGIDASDSMVEAARALGLTVHPHDMHSFDLGRKFDAVFTNAVLHWSHDISAVLGCVAKHLQPGGRFVGEFGGFGNVAAIVTALHGALQIHRLPEDGFAWYYPTPEEFRTTLDHAGFDTLSIALIPRPTPIPAGMSAWLETFARPWVKHLPKPHQSEVLATALSLLEPSLRDTQGNWTADYVRLRFHSTLRPQASSVREAT